MPPWTQHLVVLVLVAFAAFVVIRQAVGTLRLRHGKAGSCCAKGCAASPPPENRVVFLPADALKRRKR
jgi:hypothetical protein